MPLKDTVARREYSREYKRRNKARLRQMNADSDRARHANQRAARYGAPGVITIEDARAVMAAGRCYYCGSVTLLGLDHVIPLHAHGPNVRSNLVVSCRSCNASKWRGKSPRQWSRHYGRCQECGTTERKHISLGLCSPCWYRAYMPGYYERRGSAVVSDKPCGRGHAPTPENVYRRKDTGIVAYCRVCRRERRAAQRVVGGRISETGG